MNVYRGTIGTAVKKIVKSAGIILHKRFYFKEPNSPIRHSKLN